MRDPDVRTVAEELSANRSQSKASWKSGAIHSGEVVESKGGNHKTLKDWKAQYSAQEVESWLAQ